MGDGAGDGVRAACGTINRDVSQMSRASPPTVITPLTFGDRNHFWLSVALFSEKLLVLK